MAIDFKSPEWKDRLSHSGYFLAAVLLHLIIFLMVATWVIFPAFKPPVDDFQKTYIPSGAPPPPPPAQTVTVPTHNIAPPTPVIQSMSAQAPTFNIPLPDLTPPTAETKETTKMTAPPVKSTSNLASRLPSIRSTVVGWGRDPNNILNSHGDTHNVVAKFPVYVASYANGDWDCNLDVTNGKITAGSIPNLVEKINEWSHGNIKGEVVATPLQIGGPELLGKKPPFIFFTGHKDFTLTPQEIKNLQDYLQNGGAIWGDNALAGEGSRFDVAFRREMKKVIPDVDKNFEPVPMTHEIFAKSWFQIDEIPEGMNYYNEPVQHIDIDGKLAVIYTPNDYSDMMFLRILPGDKEVDTVREPSAKHPLYTNDLMYFRRENFYRNFELDSALASQQLGMNIIAFLLVRFDQDLMLAP